MIPEVRAVSQSRLILGLSMAQLITWGSVFYTFALLVEPIPQPSGADSSSTSLPYASG